MNGSGEKLTLGALVARLQGAELISGVGNTPVEGVSLDSRNVDPGALFVALPGSSVDGLAFAEAAIQSGAIGIAVPVEASQRALAIAGEKPVVACERPRHFAAHAAAELAGNPSEALVVVAVTGTSGKTTTTYLLESIFEAAGHPAGVVGTIEYRFAGEARPAPLTTPDAVTLQGLFREMREAQITHVAIEASSHALEQGRIDATEVDAAIYTNLSRDHLDYHGGLEAYAAAKARLFHEVLPESRTGSFAVLNGGDAAVAGLAPTLSVTTVSFGDQADVRAEDVEIRLDGLHGVLCLGEDRHVFSSSLIGPPHLENVLAAAAATWRLGIDPKAIVDGIAACQGVPGRLETIETGQDFTVFVDYAHKPDALARTLESLRPLTRGRLIVLFGCGGDRDRGKRPQMGEIAARLADLVVLTSDNPRTEDPEFILREIEAGMQGTACSPVLPTALGTSGVVGEYAVVPERRAAIGVAVASARVDDVVLIAGKGHEDYQIVGTERCRFDDREEARLALGERG